ncbi:MAG TPA: hypothetical protein VF487_15365 [Chitinophagaceae bacterium]
MKTEVYSNIKSILYFLKEELENNIQFIESEIIELTEPSMMGNSGLYYHLETDSSGIAVFFWDSGVFEISTDVVVLEREDNVFFSYVPNNELKQEYPRESLILFREKIKELLSLLKETYPNIRTVVT